jgi:hypothetical protein
VGAEVEERDLRVCGYVGFGIQSSVYARALHIGYEAWLLCDAGHVLVGTSSTSRSYLIA